MTKPLTAYNVAVLVADGFEESELISPQEALTIVGALTYIISPEKTAVRTWSHGNWAKSDTVDVPLERASADDYDALLLPGGVMNPDTLRLYPDAIRFIRETSEAGKPIAAICHGPWTLINAELVKGKTITSWPSIRVDLENAGANWVDKEVVVDGNIVTSRKPGDLPAFNKAMITLFAQ